VESEGIEGKGSRFTFVIPQPKPEPLPNTVGARAERREDVLRPLIVVAAVDEQSGRLAGDYLEGVGYRVVVDSEMEKLAARLRSNRPYAVVIDHKITQHCGERELRDLRAEIPASIPTVISSADAEGRPTFTLFTGERTAAAATKSRLTDAVRHTNGSSDKEVKTVLIIEDEPALLELLAKTLVFRGFHVLPAATGRRGIEVAIGAHPDVIILDLSMPDCSGIQVVEQLRARPDTKRIPILIHTGTALNELERQHLASHVQSITSKTEPQSLFANLDRLQGAPAETVKQE
jgi:CheY-like chemotaxis protein